MKKLLLASALLFTSCIIQSKGPTAFIEQQSSTPIFVSVNGNDSNSGLSELTPIASLQRASQIIGAVPGTYDVQLHRGDTFVGTLDLKYSGSVTDYGSGPLPTIDSLSGDAVTAYAIDGWSIRNINMLASTYTGGNEQPNGVVVLSCTTRLSVTNCDISRYCIGVCGTSTATKNNIIVKNCHVHDIQRIGSASVGHGVYMAAVNGLIINGNIIERICMSDPTVFRHGIYIASGDGQCNGVIIVANILDQCCESGIELRSGGFCSSNVIARTAIGIHIGGGDTPTPGGVVATVTNNFIIQGNNINSVDIRGWGFQMSNLRDSVISGNVIAHCEGSFPVYFSADEPITNTYFENNKIWDWDNQTIINHGSGVPIPGLIHINDITGPFVAPNRKFTDQQWSSIRDCLRYLIAGYSL